MLTHPTLDQMNALGLAGMAAYRELIEQAHGNDLSFRCSTAEIALRSRRLTNRLATAKLGFANASIEDIDFGSHRGLDRRNVLSLAQGAWLKANEKLNPDRPNGHRKDMDCLRLRTNSSPSTIRCSLMPRLFEDLALARLDAYFQRLIDNYSHAFVAGTRRLGNPYVERQTAPRPSGNL